MGQGEQAVFWSFPFFFVALWLCVTTLLGAFSGWFVLQKRFPDLRETPLVTLHFRSGSMGLGVAMRSILTLSACPSGLRVSIWRVFGPFQKPFLVPWAEVRVETVTRFFQPMTKLSFGPDVAGKLTTDRRSWQRLATAATSQQATVGLSIPTISEGKLLTSMVMQWVALTAFAGAFFYFGPRISFGTWGPPLSVCLGFPAVFFGIQQAFRYFVQRRRGSSSTP